MYYILQILEWKNEPCDLGVSEQKKTQRRKVFFSSSHIKYRDEDVCCEKSAMYETSIVFTRLDCEMS